MNRNFILLLLCLGMCITATVTAQNKKRSDSTQVVIYLENTLNKNAPVDSVLIIFDRYNLTGAGTVRKVYYPVNNTLIIPDVPEGKFFITVICLGIYHQQFSAISYVYDQRKNKNHFRFHLKPAEAFNPVTVKIPAQKVNPLQFAIFRNPHKHH